MKQPANTAIQAWICCSILVVLLSMSTGRIFPQSAEHLMDYPPQLELEWRPVTNPQSDSVHMTPIVVDLDLDGVPEIVFISTDEHLRPMLRAIRGTDGKEILNLASDVIDYRSGMAAGDINHDGYPEIIVQGQPLFNGRPFPGIVAFDRFGEVLWMSEPIDCIGNLAHPLLVDIDHDGSVEVVACDTVFNDDGSTMWASDSPITPGVEVNVADIDLDGEMELVNGVRAYTSVGGIKWESDAQVNWSAIANLDQDNFGEVVANALGKLFLLEHNGEIAWGPVRFPMGEDVNNPSTSASVSLVDTDSDGRAEIALAANRLVSLIDDDGSVLWSTEDDNALARLGIVAGDLDSDGTIELVYHGYYSTRIYSSSTGDVIWESKHLNRYGAFPMSSAVIADVDSDGRAEIVVGFNNMVDDPPFIGGIRVYGNRAWAPTRRIWNQQGYHGTNVNDDGSIPRVETPHWLEGNSHRANLPIEVTPVPTPDGLFLPVLMNEKTVQRPQLAIVIAIDMSESMAGDALDSSIGTVYRFIESLSWSDVKIALIAFDVDARVVQDLTDDRETLVAKLETLARNSGSYGAPAIELSQSVLEASQDDPSTAAAIVLVSDGALRDAERVIEAGQKVQDDGVEIITIGVGARADHHLLQLMVSPAGLYLNASDTDDSVDLLTNHVEKMRSCLQYDYWGGRC